MSAKKEIIGFILHSHGHHVGDKELDALSGEPALRDKLDALLTELENQLAAVEGKATTPQAEESAEAIESTEDAVTEADAEQAAPRPELWKLMPYYEFETPAKSTLEPTPPVLKPGQVPPARSAEAERPRPAPCARISVPNARAGEAFCAPLVITLDDGQTATINDVVIPDACGLHFDKAQQVLSGVPTQSGDIEMLVRWSCASHESGETPLLFVVNPDPRSLWKIIEPPADAPYPKAHVEHEGIVRDGVKIAGASRRGRSHEHAGSFRDDDFYLNHSEETGWSVMLVADGAGSAANSREGSRIAAEVAGEYLFSQLRGPRGAELKQQIARWGTEEQQNTINAMLHHFKQAATLAVNSISNEAIRAEQPVKTYSTTLLATVSLRLGEQLFAASFWLGDGAIAAYSPSGKVRVLGNPDSGEYAGQTRFLDASIIADPAFSGRISVGKWQDVSHLILMTDGVSDPRFETDNGLRSDEKWTQLVNELSPLLADAGQAPERLAEWLNFFSPGNHDDRTLVLAW